MIVGAEEGIGHATLRASAAAVRPTSRPPTRSSGCTARDTSRRCGTATWVILPTENCHGLVVGVVLTEADGFAEREGLWRCSSEASPGQPQLARTVPTTRATSSEMNVVWG